MREGNVFCLSSPVGGRYPSQVQLGGGGYPSQVQAGGGGTPASIPQDRTVHGVLDTLRSVCLLRSRRRTFLFRLVCKEKKQHFWHFYGKCEFSISSLKTLLHLIFTSILTKPKEYSQNGIQNGSSMGC